MYLGNFYLGVCCTRRDMRSKWRTHFLHLGNECLCLPLLQGSRSCNKSDMILIPTVSDFTRSNDDKFHVRLLVVLLSFSSSTSSSINPSSSSSSSLSVLVLLRSPGKCLYIAVFSSLLLDGTFPYSLHGVGCILFILKVWPLIPCGYCFYFTGLF